ncbi:MAG: hypothetical protein M3456_10875 [Actinomycetota bacterium]|nr:hypothetical protein [Actinomycetota bacterium]
MGLRDRPSQGLTTSCSRVALQAVDEGADGLRLERVHSENDRGVRTRIEALEKLIGRLEVAQTRLVQSFERDDDPGGAMFRRIRERMNELKRQRLAKIDELRSLQVREARHEPGSVDLLEELPVDDGIMKSPPEPILRWLFEAFRLEVRYDMVAGWADCSVTIQEETVDHLSAKQLPVVADGRDQHL